MYCIYHLYYILKYPLCKATPDEVAERLDPVLAYLMDQLTVLSSMLYSHVFAKVMKKLWDVIMNDLLSMLVLHSPLNKKSQSKPGKVSFH